MQSEARSFRREGVATLEQARAFALEAGQKLRAWRLPVDRAAIWEVAVAEMATNVARHGYPDGEPGPMELVITWDDEGHTISVVDEGVRFDPTSIRPPQPDPDDPSTWPEGGMGLHFVRAAGDSLTYRCDGPRHELSLFSAVPGPPGPVEV